MGELYLAKTYKRFFATLLDYCLVFLLAYTFYMFLASSIIDIGFHNSQLNQDIYRVQERSHLFEVTHENGEISTIDILRFDGEEDDPTLKYLEAINDFYFTYLERENKSNRDLNLNFFLFNEDTLENEVFKISSLDDSYQDFILKDVVISNETLEEVSKDDNEAYLSAINNYFNNETKGVYNLALTSFTSSEEFVLAEQRLLNVERYEMLLSLFVSSIIIFAPPYLLNKNGESLFMYILKLGFATRNGYKVTFPLKLIRLFVSVFLTTISLYLYGIPLIINIIVWIINKEKRSLVDIASNMVCCDMIKSTIYKDYEEMEKDK